VRVVPWMFGKVDWDLRGSWVDGSIYMKMTLMTGVIICLLAYQVKFSTSL